VRVEGAPYEDVIFLFVRPTSEIIQKTFLNCSAQLYARRDDGEYQIVMRGRAVAGPNVMAHPRRSDLLPWVPEGASPRGFFVISFFAEEVEYHRKSGDREEAFTGKTPLGREAPTVGKRWFQGAFGGILPVSVISVFAIWGYLLFQGPDYPYRTIALVTATLSILMLQAGARLWYRSTAFLRWRVGRAHIDEAGELFPVGLLAPTPSRQLSGILSVLGLALLGALTMWPNRLAGVTLLVSLVWIQWPLWVIHLSQSKPEVRDIQ